MSEYYQWMIWKMDSELGYRISSVPASGGLITYEDGKITDHNSRFLSREQLDMGQWLLDEVSDQIRQVGSASGSKITWDVLDLKEKLYNIVTTEL